ncbi:DEAD/DEAH box helicase [Mesorhizobium sp. B2-3-15]|uniref:DEAD/DEAH box helicase n=1 Tax=Mesorhizobium sp. B2-3-15 TaxID=2589949 RepID=UPI001126B6A6|nr:DEAD/DEAH box helicase [Mesorhizobium sp. B2-3-15]TPL75952.1 DEAD/DEAH box helicase [Mesorhizobium sp. B2-3-15]
MTFELSYDAARITLRFSSDRSGLLGRFMRVKKVDLETLSGADRRLVLALADLKSTADGLGEAVQISADRITLGHRLAAALDNSTAVEIGLPALTDLTLRTDAEGVLGTEGFRLQVQWQRSGQQRTPKRTGSLLETDRGLQRLPLWMLEAIQVAEGFRKSKDDAEHWEALARFRKALEPGVDMSADSAMARLSMTDFLSGLEVSLADGFSISPTHDGDDFEVLPFANERLDPDEVTSEAMAELAGPDLAQFQRRLRERGALNAFRLAPGKFLVVDRSAGAALKVMADMQRAAPEERRAFVRNPRARITEAVEAQLRRQSGFQELSSAAQEEAVEAAAGPLFIETEEYSRFSDRVTGIETYSGNPIGEVASSGTTWLPEVFTDEVLKRLDKLRTPELEELRDRLQTAIERGAATLSFEGIELPANGQTLHVLEGRLQSRRPADEEPNHDDVGRNGPIILKTEVNFDDVSWRPIRGPRHSNLGDGVPYAIKTRLKDHQVESLGLQIESWKAGLPGILNADEQGLGKTLQTIAFLTWLNEHMKRDGTAGRGPMLIVAPTSLLENWELEVSQHVESPGLGHLIRLYGSATGARKLAGANGRDTLDGESRLDFSDIHGAINTGAGHLTWILTTYTTLTNYQHSLGKIPFAVAVFDEIQNIKNPGTLAANAARAINADFRIGLTGTPIENSTVDLWAIMDQLTPGALGSLREFRDRYGTPDEDNMSELHSRVFKTQNGLPPLAFRRLKETVARDLPTKSRFMHPRAMPPLQADRYEEARVKLASGGPGAALKMLHHIRSVSVHPAINAQEGAQEFIDASGRLAATFDILRRIKSARERALVFIESRQMQFRFMELVRAEFGLARVELINGDTPIQKRQAVVNRFQQHLTNDGGFDLLVLGPKAAGTGLTLTAATHVIHLSRWWNPAVEEQCNDRVHRLGQTRPVTVHVPMAVHPEYREHSFDLLLQSLMQKKRKLASSALWPMGDSTDDAAHLQHMLREEGEPISGRTIDDAMAAMMRRDGINSPAPNAMGAWEYK